MVIFCPRACSLLICLLVFSRSACCFSALSAFCYTKQRGAPWVSPSAASRQVRTNTILCESSLLCTLGNRGPGPALETLLLSSRPSHCRAGEEGGFGQMKTPQSLPPAFILPFSPFHFCLVAANHWLFPLFWQSWFCQFLLEFSMVLWRMDPWSCLLCFFCWCPRPEARNANKVCFWLAGWVLGLKLSCFKQAKCPIKPFKQ